MIISRTPYRISFFGGGTDYPAWYKNNGGAVLSTTIDKYCYIFCRVLPPFFEHKHRIVWSKIETVKKISEIEHPAVKAILKTMKVDGGVEIHHVGDLPAQSGLGSSSSFTVGLLHSIFGLKGIMPTKLQLATQAIHIERDVLRENVGSQDQVSAAFGGFNKISFNDKNEINIKPIIMNPKRLKRLQNYLLLYFTGLTRIASDVAKTQIENTSKKKKELIIISQMVDEAIKILTQNNNLLDFGKLLHETWMIKRSLSNRISSQEIDNIYELARKAGAIGGKLLGAGGGGFMLLFARPQDQPRIRKKLNKFMCVPFEFEEHGSEIIFNRYTSYHE